MKQWQAISLIVPDDDLEDLNDQYFRFELHDDGRIVEVIQVDFPSSIDPEIPDAHPLDEESIEDRIHAMLSGLNKSLKEIN